MRTSKHHYICIYVCMHVCMYKRWAIKSSPCTATFNDLLRLPSTIKSHMNYCKCLRVHSGNELKKIRYYSVIEKRVFFTAITTAREMKLESALVHGHRHSKNKISYTALFTSHSSCSNVKLGRAIVQTVSRWLPTVAVRVRTWVQSCGICGGPSGAVAGFL
jgi:hypothetical protein